ncbi:MAG: prepilin-type N-terminal cleavage/methylation domain-containing protein [Elusimicrobia bacterium]|nr:prepilin-type N-terminal cleavage/methylation domain-containing protein [Elusimicrobiota bacterium]
MRKGSGWGKPKNRLDSVGFTLIELLVVMIIMGVLALVAMPRYTKSVETSKADQAVAQLRLISNAHRMWSLDNNGGWLPAWGFDTNALCNVTTCPSPGTASCAILIGCNYLGPQDWQSASYRYLICNPAGGAGECCNIAGVIACAARQDTTASPCAPGPAWCTWGYRIDQNGVVTVINGAPVPPS